MGKIINAIRGIVGSDNLLDALIDYYKKQNMYEVAEQLQLRKSKPPKKQNKIKFNEFIEETLKNTTDDDTINYILLCGDVGDINESLTPPTEEEVCEVLTDWGIKTGDWENVWYKNGIFYADEWTLCYINKDGALEINCEDLLPKDHVLLGRFYEGRENNKTTL